MVFFLFETWHSSQFNYKPITDKYNIIENYGNRLGNRGRLSNGYILAISKIIFPRIRVNKQTEQYISIQYLGERIKVNMCFTYLSSLSISPLEHIFSNVDQVDEICFIIGDLNARIGLYQNENQCQILNRNSYDKSLNTRGRKLISLLDQSNFIVMNGCTFSDRNGEYTFANLNGCSVIDLCLATTNIAEHVDLRVLDTEGSSHFPILISINDIPLQETTFSYDKIIWDDSKTHPFLDNLDNLLSYHPSDEISLPQYINIINQAAKDSCLTKVINNKKNKLSYGPAWFDKKCLIEKKVTLSKLREFRLSRNVETLTKYLAAKRSYSNLLKAKKIRFTKTLDNNLSQPRNAYQFYRALSYYRPKKFNRPNSQSTVSIDSFKNFFQDKFSGNNKVDEIHAPVINIIELDSPFSIQELNVAIAKLSRNKAPGPDKIPNEIIKALDDNNRTTLLNCINKT